MIREVDLKTFEKDSVQGAVLLVFYSKTCGPCKMLRHVLIDLDKQMPEDISILMIDYHAYQNLAEEYEVTGFPTLIVLKDGQESSRKSGLQPQEKIKTMIKEAQANDTFN